MGEDNSHYCLAGCLRFIGSAELGSASESSFVEHSTICGQPALEGLVFYRTISTSADPIVNFTVRLEDEGVY
ncbi:unnamed protein product [Nezara viridula]|uniref:Uncharacterized protein n=1 Tax=Nezara viridula TaxID=85310 RepID=A0A9P0EE87_NEZVI|nr:unnamed protein product [Nezara viridula]